CSSIDRVPAGPPKSAVSRRRVAPRGARGASSGVLAPYRRDQSGATPPRPRRLHYAGNCRNPQQSMIPKSGYRFSEKLMVQQRAKRDDGSKKRHHALARTAPLRRGAGQRHKVRSHRRDGGGARLVQALAAAAAALRSLASATSAALVSVSAYSAPNTLPQK